MKIHNVEQNSPEWDALRSGIPTASAFSKLVTSKGEDSKSLEPYAQMLAAEKYAGTDLDGFDGNKYTERGHELEDEAFKQYEFMKQEAVVEKVGFITDDEGTIGCSPDALVNDDGMLEIKNLSAKVHMETILYHRKNGKAPPKYYQQPPGQVFVAERKWCDLFFHHPHLPPLIIREHGNKIFHEALEDAIKTVSERRDDIWQILEDM